MRLRSRFVGVPAAVLMALASNAYAQSSGYGTIGDITICDGDQYARISVGNTAITDRPACHDTSYTGHYAFDLSTVKGKALMTTATAAMLAGKRISVSGTGTCLTVAPGLNLEAVSALTVWP